MDGLYFASRTSGVKEWTEDAYEHQFCRSDGRN